MAGIALQVSWPLSIVVDDQVLGKYNQILIFLMQVTCSWPARTLHAAKISPSAGTSSVRAYISWMRCQVCFTPGHGL